MWIWKLNFTFTKWRKCWFRNSCRNDRDTKGCYYLPTWTSWWVRWIKEVVKNFGEELERLKCDEITLLSGQIACKFEKVLIDHTLKGTEVNKRYMALDLLEDVIYDKNLEEEHLKKHLCYFFNVIWYSIKRKHLTQLCCLHNLRSLICGLYLSPHNCKALNMRVLELYVTRMTRSFLFHWLVN